MRAVVGEPRDAVRHRPARSGARRSAARRDGAGGGIVSVGRSTVTARPGRGKRPADGQVRVGQVGRGDAADVVGLDGQGRAVLVLPGAPVVPERDVAQPRGQARQVLLLPAPGGLEPVPRPRQLLGRRPLVGQPVRGSRRSPPRPGPSRRRGRPRPGRGTARPRARPPAPSRPRWRPCRARPGRPRAATAGRRSAGPRPRRAPGRRDAPAARCASPGAPAPRPPPRRARSRAGPSGGARRRSARRAASRPAPGARSGPRPGPAPPRGPRRRRRPGPRRRGGNAPGRTSRRSSTPILARSSGQPRIGLRYGWTQVGDGQVRLVEPPQGRVEVPGPLLGDDVPLGLDLARVERRPAHPVGLDGQGQLPAVGGEGEPVMRAVLARLGVRLPGRDERQAVDLPLGEPLGPLEQHVLDEVRQPGLARGLVHRADRVVQVADHQRAHGSWAGRGP